MTSPDSQPPSSPTAGNILGTTPAGFSPDQQTQALTLKARILAGENIPLSELKAFILSAEADLSQIRTTRNVKEKKIDVDFF
jgi:hypothetical protein